MRKIFTENVKMISINVFLSSPKKTILCIKKKGMLAKAKLNIPGKVYVGQQMVCVVRGSFVSHS